MQRRVGFIGLFPRRLRGQLNDGIEFWIDLGDPLQMRFNDRLAEKSAAGCLRDFFDPAGGSFRARRNDLASANC